MFFHRTYTKGGNAVSFYITVSGSEISWEKFPSQDGQLGQSRSRNHSRIDYRFTTMDIESFVAKMSRWFEPTAKNNVRYLMCHGHVVARHVKCLVF
jgi:hypothetical protein